MPATDNVSNNSEGVSSPPRRAIALDAQFHDTNELTQLIRNFTVNVSGNVKAVYHGDTTAVTFYAAAGVTYWGIIKQVFATGTTATGMVGRW